MVFRESPTNKGCKAPIDPPLHSPRLPMKKVDGLPEMEISSREFPPQLPSNWLGFVVWRLDEARKGGFPCTLYKNQEFKSPPTSKPARARPDASLSRTQKDPERPPGPRRSRSPTAWPRRRPCPGPCNSRTPGRWRRSSRPTSLHLESWTLKRGYGGGGGIPYKPLNKALLMAPQPLFGFHLEFCALASL